MVETRIAGGVVAQQGKERQRWRELRKRLWRDRWLYLMVLPVVVYYIVFHYVPMAGVVIAFKQYDPFTGIVESPWVGFKHFLRFFDSIYFFRLIRNTILLNVYGLVVGFPAPIILALMLNEVTRPLFKRVVQTISYLPYFCSTVVIVGIVVNFLSPTTGMVNQVIKALGGQPIAFLSSPEWFRHVYVWSGVWQGVGWSSIIYLAALAGIDPALYEAAEMDGAGRFAKMWHISIPGIAPVIMVLLLLNLGNMLNVGFEKVFLLYNPSTYSSADVISTYVYRAGLLEQQYDFGAAVGLFNSVVSLVLLTAFNWLAGKLGQQTLW